MPPKHPRAAWLNTATVTSGDPACVAPLPARCTSTVTVTDASQPNLVVNKSASVASGAAGTSFTYTIVVSNTGPVGSASNTSIVDAVPAGISITGLVNGSGWTCNTGHGDRASQHYLHQVGGSCSSDQQRNRSHVECDEDGDGSVVNTANVTSGDPRAWHRCPPAVPALLRWPMQPTWPARWSVRRIRRRLGDGFLCGDLYQRQHRDGTWSDVFGDERGELAGWGDGGVSERDGAGGCSGGQQSGLQRDLHGDGTGDGDGELDDGATNEPSGRWQQQRHRHGRDHCAADWIGHGEHGKLHADARVVGSPITCTAICENVGTVTATAASCSINTSGLPGHRWRAFAERERRAWRRWHAR